MLSFDCIITNFPVFYIPIPDIDWGKVMFSKLFLWLVADIIDWLSLFDFLVLMLFQQVFAFVELLLHIY